MSLTKISIVTPNYNGGEFLEETIQSVLGQNYPGLEYIIIDGGSTDNSIDIIKKYSNFLSYWESERDRGQSHALNKGFRRATGEILGWLNSDDMYLPGTLLYISKVIDPKNAGIYFGDCIHFRYDDEKLTCRGSNVSGKYKSLDLSLNDFIIQPSTFWTAETMKTVGFLNENLHYGFDWEWFIRASKCVPFYPVTKPLSLYRLNENQKTSSGGLKRQKEISEIYGKYNPRVRKLYNMLCEESLLKPNMSMKMISHITGIFGRKTTPGYALKILKIFKYFNFEISEIDQLIPMR